MDIFKDKVAVITGAANGIGKALSLQCAKAGMKVILADRDQDSLDRCKKELRVINKNIICVVTDVTKSADLARLAQTTLNNYDQVHFLFNNAGISGELGPFWEQPIVDIEKVIQTNLMEILYGMRIFTPIMLSQNSDCYIINTAAGGGLLTGPSLAAYKTSKHAAVALSEVVAADLAALNAKINVSIIIPHLIKTNIIEQIKNCSPAEKEKLNEIYETAMLPGELANIVFEGITSKKFYIFSHFEIHAPKIRQRMENILNGHF